MRHPSRSVHRTHDAASRVDAMGGDHAPSAVVDGAVAAARHLDVRRRARRPARRRSRRRWPRIPDWRALGLEIVDAPDVDRHGRVARGDAAAQAAGVDPGGRRPRGARQARRALFSAGHTGATVMAAHARVRHDSRRRSSGAGDHDSDAAASGGAVDAGANVECRPQHLLQFAVMGSVYARVALGVERPRVGLLSIGEEETKGNELTREAHRLLKAAPLNFIGNVEGREIYSGVADVIVCDGFTGNVVLKTSEGLVETVEALLGDELQGTFSSQVGYLLSRRAFRRFRRRVDYSEYGGAPLLGVAGLAIVGHGRSSAKAVRNAIAMAYRFAAQRLHSPRRAGDRRRLGAAPVIAFLFPGQGSQKVGMGKALAEAFPEARAAFDEADAALRRGALVRALCFDGPEDQLTLTENTQPAILTVSIAACARAGGARHRRRRSSPATAWASTRPTWRPGRSAFARCGAASCGGAGATCRRRCRSGRARWRPSSGSTPAPVQPRVRGGGRGRGGQPGEHQQRRARS